MKSITSNTSQYYRSRFLFYNALELLRNANIFQKLNIEQLDILINPVSTNQSFKTKLFVLLQNMHDKLVKYDKYNKNNKTHLSSFKITPQEMSLFMVEKFGIISYIHNYNFEIYAR